MTSNAKIGLLLGLAVIFMIVFVINGLSGFDDAGDGDELSPLAVNDTTGIKPDIPPEVFPIRQVPARPHKKTSSPVKRAFEVNSRELQCQIKPKITLSL
ncbi:MAG: hypothetical protein ACYSUX_05620 [Planctomycetota bacterium]|jgi:hypothetical protein